MMETSDLYEVEQLSLFGDQLLFGFGSPMEPDSPVNSPGVGYESNQLDLLGIEQLPRKPKTVDDNPESKLDHVPVPDSPNGLELGWMDTKHDIIDLLQECTGSDSASPIAEESMPVINLVSEPVTWPSSEDTTDVVGADNTPVDTDIDNDLLCEAFKLLDKAGVSVDDLVQFGSFLDGTEDGQSDASVAGSELNPSGVVIADDDAGPSDSGLESLVSSCPSSPLDAAEFSPFYETPTLDHPRAKSKRGRRVAPYSKLPADRKERKKIQNKTAALKYRQKKKEETKQVFTEVELLELKNKELKNKVESISKEISYLKQLMSDVLKAKS